MPVEEAILVTCDEGDEHTMRELLGEIQKLALKYEKLSSVKVRFTEEL